MTVSIPHAKAGARTNRPIPPLENGDRLTRDEFGRRYEAMPQLKKAELIEGVVYTIWRVRYLGHGVPHARIVGWLGNYSAYTRGVGAANNSTVRLDRDNEPQPDALLRIKSPRIGQSKVSDDDFLEGAPELITEVASSSVSYDLGPKLVAYRRNGVREYIAWRVLDEEIDRFVLQNNRYEPMVPAADGILRSAIFPGLWLDAAALLRGDLTRVLEVLTQGLESEEHAAFVKRLGEDAPGAP